MKKSVLDFDQSETEKREKLKLYKEARGKENCIKCKYVICNHAKQTISKTLQKECKETVELLFPGLSNL